MVKAEAALAKRETARAREEAARVKAETEAWAKAEAERAKNEAARAEAKAVARANAEAQVMLGSGWYLPVVLSGLSGKFADRNGIYYPTAEMINGGLVYKARHKGLILQYTAAKNWKVSPLSDKGSDKGCAFIAAPNPSRPIERVPGTWQVWNDTDKKWEAKAEVKVCSEAEAEASANAEAEASAKAEAEALLGSGRYLPVVLSGLSAPYADRNGIYDPTAEIIKGGLVYKARHGDYILQYSTIRSWMVTDLSDKGTDMGYAFIAAHPPSQPIELTTARAFITSTGFLTTAGGWPWNVWQVWNGRYNAWEDKMEVNVRSFITPAL